MPNSSQSFKLLWYDKPIAWLADVERLGPKDARDLWKWQITHHQLLTLAQRSSRESGVSALWFSVTDVHSKIVLLGALLPGDRLAFVASTGSRLTPSIISFLQSRTAFKSAMGESTTMQNLGATLVPKLETNVVRQTAWGRWLGHSVGQTPPQAQPAHETLSLVARRAGPLDLQRLRRWSQVFAIETQTDALALEDEVSELVHRALLFIFETPGPVPQPIGMAALSGDFIDLHGNRSCRISLIYTDPPQRGRGYGALILRSIEHEARFEKAAGLVLYSDPRNIRATKFYSGLGFTAAGEWIETPSSGFNVNTTG